MSTPSFPTKKVLTLAWGRRLAEAALAAAEERRLEQLVIVVTDDAGTLLYLMRQDGAEPAAVDIGIAKARTAALFRRPTRHWKELLLEGKHWVLAMPNLTPVEGGQPIVVDGQTIGGIGIAGASGVIDTEIGTTALAILQQGATGE